MEICIDEYLKYEKKLHNWFVKINFCKFDPGDGHCITGNNLFCCNRDYPTLENCFSWGKELDKYREKKFGKSKAKKGYACGRLDIKNGCQLKTHKPVKCISYICDNLYNYLKKNNIYFDSEFLERFFINVLINKVEPEELETFNKLESQIEEFIKD